MAAPAPSRPAADAPTMPPLGGAPTGTSAADGSRQWWQPDASKPVLKKQPPSAGCSVLAGVLVLVCGCVALVTAHGEASATASCSGVNGNPWCYDFNPGNLIYSPPGAFCSYFNCINNFLNGRGYVMECQDGMYSKSGGIQGSCSYHGGNWRPLYSH